MTALFEAEGAQVVAADITAASEAIGEGRVVPV